MKPTLAASAGLIFGSAVAGITWYAFKLGVFRKVEWTTGSLEGFSYVYVEHKGAYHNIGPKYDELAKMLGDVGVKVSSQSHRSIGIYHDDPKEVKADELRSVAGYILPPGELAVAKERGLLVATVPPQPRGLKTTFPLHTVPLSIIVAVMKVYPALSKHRGTSGVDDVKDIAEIYDFASKRIDYFAFPAT